MNIKVLVSGASGYIGGRLIPELLSAGHSVRAMAREPEFVRGRFSHQVGIVKGDVMDLQSLELALSGVDVAFYLVHSMGSSEDFETRDRVGAENFGKACLKNQVKRIVYLGGLGNDDDSLSPHLRSRHEVAEILRASGVQTIEFRASAIIGAGSLSYELVRSLTERLPVMVAPKWVQVKAQPIAVADVLAYLVCAVDIEGLKQPVFEIGGKDRVSYLDLIRIYARLRGLKRRILVVPFLTPWVSSLWLGLITPVYARIGRKLIESIKHPTVVRDSSALDVFDIVAMSVKNAMVKAIHEEEKSYSVTHWYNAVSSGKDSSKTVQRFGNRIVDCRTILINGLPSEVFPVLSRMGGDVGWYYANSLWHLRAAIDLIMGGVGMRRRRRDPERMVVGDVVDFWRVEKVEAGKLIRLRAEMKLPGRAWLEYEVLAEKDAAVRLSQTAIFDPVGLFGLMYWYFLYPLHFLIFRGMLKGIKRRVERKR